MKKKAAVKINPKFINTDSEVGQMLAGKGDWGIGQAASPKVLEAQADANKDFRKALDIGPNKQVGGTHYNDKKIQPWAAMEEWMTPEQFVGFLRGSALKYLARCDDKGGLEDIKKAQHYIDKLVEFSEERM